MEFIASNIRLETINSYLALTISILGSVWLGVFGGEERGGEGILLVICVWFIFLRRGGEGRPKGRGGNIRPFLLSPKLGGFGGEVR
jgi:hypothetical protein